MKNFLKLRFLLKINEERTSLNLLVVRRILGAFSCLSSLTQAWLKNSQKGIAENTLYSMKVRFSAMSRAARLSRDTTPLAAIEDTTGATSGYLKSSVGFVSCFKSANSVTKSSLLSSKFVNALNKQLSIHFQYFPVQLLKNRVICCPNSILHSLSTSLFRK